MPTDDERREGVEMTRILFESYRSMLVDRARRDRGKRDWEGEQA